jgi:hypothetical protein
MRTTVSFFTVGRDDPRAAPRGAALLALPALLLAGAPLPQEPSVAAVLGRAGAFVGRYAEELPRLVCTETMSQALSSRRSPGGTPTTRRLVAEFAWVTLDREPEAIAFRDVTEVDGQPMGAGRLRLLDLLHGDQRASWSQARAILDEGARHNLAEGSRNFNLPTVAMFFLHPERQPRFRWKRRSAARDPTWEVEFRERERPTIIRQLDGRPAFARGAVWLDVATGAIRRTDLTLDISGLTYELTTRFERIAEMDLVLPVHLSERLTTRDVVVTSAATYANYRRFQTAARLVR